LSERQWGTVREDYSECGNAWDYISFDVFFHGGTGARLGASHQTGWTGCIARLMQIFATATSELILQAGLTAKMVELAGAAR
jgi:hypothetical protein